ncbi:MAG: DUF2169 domain-containing protein [Candidatus Hodarchaeota archaeon]
MIITNDTPFPAFALPSMGPEDKPILTVVVKGTFFIRPNETATIAPQQDPIFFADQLLDPEKGGSTRFEDDIAPFKPRADIAIVGKAIAPDNRPVHMLEVGFRMGQIKKIIRVIGNRFWRTRGLFSHMEPSKPEPFTEMDLIYENAFGGMDLKWGDYCPDNPVGKGIFHKKNKKKDIELKPLPNLEDPHHLIQSWNDRPKPMGFGYIGKGWAPRLKFLGTYDEKWKEERFPQRPRDFKFDYFNAAPLDQQVDGYLKGDEKVELFNLTPNGQTQFQLPGIQPKVSVTKFGAESMSEKVMMNLDTLCIIPEDEQFYLAWRGILSIKDIVAEEIKKINVMI